MDQSAVVTQNRDQLKKKLLLCSHVSNSLHDRSFASDKKYTNFFKLNCVKISLMIKSSFLFNCKNSVSNEY